MNMAKKTPVNWYEFKMRLDAAKTKNDVTHVQTILEEVLDGGEEYERHKFLACTKVLKSKQLFFVKLLFPTGLVFQDGKLNKQVNIQLMNSAIEADFVDGIQYLHSQGLVLHIPDFKWSALEQSVALNTLLNTLEVLQYLLSIHDLDRNPNPEKTLLMVASEWLNMKAIKLLLNTEQRQTIDQQSEREKYTALHWCLQGSDPIKVMECVKLLVEAGANINILNVRGETLLMVASQMDNHDGLLEMLLGADNSGVNLQDKYGITALMLAVRNGSQQLTKILLNNGANPSLGTVEGLTPLMVASKMDGLLEILLGADNSSVNLQDKYGITALMLAVEKNLVNNTKMLLQNGSNPNICTYSGQTALMLATANNNRGIVEVLLEAPADVNIVDPNGCSVLNCVVMGGLSRKRLNMLKILLNNGCDVSLYNPRQNGKTLLQSLLETDQSDISWYLITENCSLQDLNSHKVLVHLKYPDPFQLSKVLYLCGASRADTESVCLLSLGNGSGIFADQSTITGDTSDKNKSTLEEFCVFCNTIDLKSRCRLVIRERIGAGIRRKITQVGLPTGLQDFVLLKDWIPETYVDLIINEENDDDYFIDNSDRYHDKDDYGYDDRDDYIYTYNNAFRYTEERGYSFEEENELISNNDFSDDNVYDSFHNYPHDKGYNI